MNPTRVNAGVALLLFIALCTGTLSGQDVPAEARRHMVRGQTAIELARTDLELEEALSELTQAAALAPEWPDPYYQIGCLQDRLGKYGEALGNLHRYLTLAPQAGNAAQVQELCYKIEYKRDKAYKRSLIVDALTGGVIRKKGGFPGGVTWLHRFRLVGKDIKASITHPFMKEFNQTVPVDFDGSRVKLNYIYYHANDRSTVQFEGWPFEWQVSIEATVISTSPLRLKTREIWQSKWGDHVVQHHEAEWEITPE